MRNIREQFGVVASADRPAQTRRGFSLVEVILAISILGVGMTMVAALFPAALKENESSVNDVLGSLICQNGLAVTRAKVAAAAYDNTYSEPYATKNDPANPDRFGFVSRSWPAAGAAENDFRINVVSYRLSNAANKAVLHPVLAATTSIQDHPTNAALSDLVVAAVDVSWLQPQSPVLFKDGTYAKILTVKGSAAVLDRHLTATPSVDAYIVTETDSSDKPVLNAVSPAMSTLMTRSTLR